MKKKIFALSLAFLVLCGCNSSPMEDVFRMPELPQEFAEFNDQLNKIRNAGAEYIAPTSGSNRQSVQLVDLDGDGVDEGIAFFKEPSKGYKVTVYIFKKIGDSYQIHGTFEGPGNSVESVSYSDLLGTGNYSIIIGWGVTDSDVRTLTVHDIHAEGLSKLCEIPYLYYIVSDLNMDGVNDLNVISRNDKTGQKELNLYTENNGGLAFQSSAPLSRDMEPIRKIRAGSAQDNRPGLFIDGAFHESGLMTDLILYQGGGVRNVTLDESSGQSLATARQYPAFCEDVDGDGVIEIPSTSIMPGYSSENANDVMWGIVWRDYEADGDLKEVSYSYHSYLENWHILMPLEWNGNITTEHVDSGSGESGVAFYSYDKNGSKEQLFTIYTLTGDDREANASAPGRIQLMSRPNVIFAAVIKKNEYMGQEITETTLKGMFHYRQTEWSGEDVVS